MADQDGPGAEHQNLLRSFPIENSSERIDAFWRQIMVYKAFADSDLSEAKTRRAQAEAAREKAEQETVEAAKILCESLKNEAEQKLKEAENLKAEAATILQQAEAERGRAKDLSRESEEARERIVGEAKHKAQEILDQARVATQQECTELRRQALKEVKAILGRIESARTATDEELETQRIYSNVARLKASSAALLAQPGYENDNSAGHERSPTPQQTAVLEAAADGHHEASKEEDAPAPGEDSTEEDPVTMHPPRPEGSGQKMGAKGKEKKPSKR